jgi:hypothetical protein
MDTALGNRAHKAVESGFGPRRKKFFGPLSKDGPAKNLYTKSERENLNCRATWVWSASVNLYNRQTYTVYWGPGPPSRQPNSRKFYQLPPPPGPGRHCVCVLIHHNEPPPWFADLQGKPTKYARDAQVCTWFKIRNDAKLVTDVLRQYSVDTASGHLTGVYETATVKQRFKHSA